MFIKILTPNHNEKIELTVADLEALIKEAVDKAIIEDRANRPYNTWYGGTTLLNGTSTTPFMEINCSDTPTSTVLKATKNDIEDTITARLDLTGVKTI